MPRLWTETLQSHKKDVEEAILDAAAALAREHGITGVTMSAAAERTGVTRATLYRYFPDVGAMVGAWHQRQVQRNLAELLAARDRGRDTEEQLALVLETYARLVHEQHSSEVRAMAASSEASAEGYRQLTLVLEQLIIAGIRAGRLRQDVSAAELASFCVHALEAARAATTKAALRRLVAVTAGALR